MNLNLNFRRVRQENFTENQEKNFKSAIFQEGGTMFQNSPIHLMFYEKLDILGKELVPTLEEIEELELSSMSYCRLGKEFASKLPETELDTELRLVQQGVTTCFVLMEQYQQLMFVLGQPCTTENDQKFDEILTLLNDFNTSSVENFKDMIRQIGIPFDYNANISLQQNRRQFKDFFSFLTNVRCAVVEGSHRCEATSRTLQGYELGDPVPLKYTGVEAPPTSTIFQKISAQVYYCKDGIKLDETVLAKLRQVSKEIALMKEKIVHVTWHNFFTRVLDEIIEDEHLAD